MEGHRYPKLRFSWDIFHGEGRKVVPSLAKDKDMLSLAQQNEQELRVWKHIISV